MNAIFTLTSIALKDFISILGLKHVQNVHQVTSARTMFKLSALLVLICHSKALLTVLSVQSKPNAQGQEIQIIQFVLSIQDGQHQEVHFAPVAQSIMNALLDMKYLAKKITILMLEILSAIHAQKEKVVLLELKIAKQLVEQELTHQQAQWSAIHAL